MSKFSSKSTTRNIGARISKFWSILIVCTIILLIVLIPQSRINSNLFDLLPSNSNEERYNNALLDGYLNTLDNQIIWLISDENGKGEAVAQFWSEQLSSIPEIAHIHGKKTAQELHNYGKLILETPSLLPQKIIQEIQSKEYLEWVLGQIYSPFSGISINEIKADPLLSTRAYLLEQLKNSEQFSLQNGWITTKSEDGTQWFLIRGELDASISGMLQRKAIVQQLNQRINVLTDAYPNHQLLQKGSLFYGDYAAQTAEQDITTIGSLSLLSVILIFYLFFRSYRAITLTLLALTIGILFGVTAVLIIYREIHLITIVMSTSIIGVAIDYTLFYLTSRALEGNKFTPTESLQKTFMPLLGALLSTCLAYAILIFAPFVGLEQLAIFTISGLIAVFLTVISWFPKLAKLPIQDHPTFLRFVNSYLSLWNHQKKGIIATTFFLITFTSYGLLQLQSDDDIGNLQTLPEHILSQDKKISEILNQHSTQQVLMVVGKTEEELLQNIENSYPLLDLWIQENIIESYRTLPIFSDQQQRKNLDTLKTFYPVLQSTYQENGIEDLTIPDFNQTISLETWLDSPLSDGWNLLFQVLPSSESAFIIPISQVYDSEKLTESLQAVQQTGELKANTLFWVDRKSELSSLFQTYRITMQWLLLIALASIFILFLATKGIKRGILSTFPIIMAVITPLGMFGLFGIKINLFTIMALILVVGMSIDYVLFFGSKNQPKIAFITILLAALISELTFGLLATSNTNAISNFGLVLALGIFIALLLAPYAKYSNLNQKDTPL